ncbi:MAG: L,D-transpeptidase [Pseudomonadota bacterium]
MRKFLPIVVVPLIMATSSWGTLLPTKPGDSGVDDGVRWKAYVLKDGEKSKHLFGKHAKEAIRFNRMQKKFWKEGAVIKRPVLEDVAKLKDWNPMPPTFAECPVNKSRCIVISLSKQFLGVYKFQRLKVTYPVSTGIPEYQTPTGYFKVVSGTSVKKIKLRRIFSFAYQTWMYWPLHIGGQIFIHAGDLPGYPASHGCIRLMRKDAYKLFKKIPLNTPVRIVG